MTVHPIRVEFGDGLFIATDVTPETATDLRTTPLTTDVASFSFTDTRGHLHRIVNPSRHVRWIRVDEAVEIKAADPKSL